MRPALREWRISVDAWRYRFGTGAWPVNPDSLRFDRVNQNGAMHRFDAFPENRLLKRWAKNITRILHLGPACAQRRYNSFERIDLNKSGFIPVIFIAVNNAGWDFR